MNFKYNKARERFLTGQVNWLTDTIKTLVVNGFYNANPAHEYVSEIPPGAIIRRSDPLTSKAATDGYARAAAVPYPLFSSQQQVRGIVFYKDTGDDATSPLLAYVDDGVAFPFMPLGFDYAFAYDTIEGGFFRT